MPKVTNLAIKVQSGTDSTYLATWDFKESTTTTTSTSAGIKKGSWVTVKSGATWYNGASISDFVFNYTWEVVQVSGDRAVLGKSKTGGYNIQSPINTKYLSGGSSSSTSSTTTTNYLDYYKIVWYYDTGDSIWFEGTKSEESGNKNKYSTYSPPDNALRIKVVVTPVSKTYKEGSGDKAKDVSHWKGTATSKEHRISVTHLPANPATPKTELKDLKLTMSLENINDPHTDEIRFEVYDGTKCVLKKDIAVLSKRASYEYTLKIGGSYRVRAIAYKKYGKSKVHSENYSDFTDFIYTRPPEPKGITEYRATSETSVYLGWAAVSGATKYDIEYTTELRYFDGSDQVQSINDIENTHYEKTGIETGKQYFFRLRAKNDEGESKWTEPVSLVLGEKPSAPTTWSSTTTIVVGEPLILYWVHNSEDGSSQKYAEIDMIVDGIPVVIPTIENTTDPDLKDKTSSFEINTSDYSEGAVIEWRVKTAGVTNEYGEWSVMRTVNVYAQPTAQMSLLAPDPDDPTQAGEAFTTLTQYPFHVYVLAGPNTQTPIGYHLTVTSDESYETVDQIGNAKYIVAGQEIYSNYFDITDSLMVEMSAGNIDLENNKSYTVTCTVSMDSGLTAEATSPFNVEWTDSMYEPNAEIGYDENTFEAVIRPYCIDDEGNLIEDAILSVYRREYDGSFTEITSGLQNIMSTYVVDPHPALDYARYRIVAISQSNGGVGFYDIPGIPIQCKSLIIQWDEDWTNFEEANEDEREQPTWVGSMLKLPYNVDLTDSISVDKTFIEYIGRSHPVGYYGTHVGETASWSTVIDKTDTETIYALRRLQKWKGDVYVRAPSGVGYWASVNVSFSQKHKDLTIPVTFDITRVEGGI